MSDTKLRELERQVAAGDESQAPRLAALRAQARRPDPDAVHSHPQPRYEWIVQTASACMPTSCWGRYSRVAVLELELGWPAARGVSMISTHARGVRRVIETWEKLYHGTTDRCAFYRALEEAQFMCDGHNV